MKPPTSLSPSQAAGLSWLEKKAATAFFAAPPESSYEEALECFMRVRVWGEGEG